MSDLAPASPVTRPSARVAPLADRPDIAKLLSHPAKPKKATAKAVWPLSAVSGLLMFLAFEPVDFGPAGWVALVPLLVLARPAVAPKWTYCAAFAGGLCWTVPQLQWMRLADPMMALGWALLAVYVAAYFPTFLALVRAAVHRLGVSLPLAAAVVWTGLELVRAHVMTGFPWYFLGHSQHRFETLIQVSDLGGAYGVSLVLASFAGLAAWAVPSHVLTPWFGEGRCPDVGAQRLRPAALACGAVLAGCLGYGSVRLSQASFEPGPSVAVVQGNFTSSMKHDSSQFEAIQRAHERMTMIAAGSSPDLILWPETMFRWPYMITDEQVTDEEIRALSPYTTPAEWRSDAAGSLIRDTAARSGTNVLLGAVVDQISSAGGAAERRRYNAAVMVRPGDRAAAEIEGWYGKHHLLPFGEYWPSWLPAFGPLKPLADAGLDAGPRSELFDVNGVTAAPLICFEDTVPHVVREAVKGQDVDVLLNLTNDGWFHGSSELNQHLITAAFRCVETRTPMVRAVNTGISAFIDGNGVVREPAEMSELVDGRPVPTTLRDESGNLRKSLNAVLVADVPLDARTSLYVACGDWLAGGCLLLTVIGGLLAWRRPGPSDVGNL